jgi:hypothetical protein
MDGHEGDIASMGILDNSKASREDTGGMYGYDCCGKNEADVDNNDAEQSKCTYAFTWIRQALRVDSNKACGWPAKPLRASAREASHNDHDAQHPFSTHAR